MYIDIHTHDIDNKPIIKIVDENKETIHQVAGIHPWQLDCVSDTTHLLADLISSIEHENIVAIGEVGIDKVHKDTVSVQEKTFKEEIFLSEKFHKPLIIHAVRAYPDIINFRKITKARQPWIIHGFNGNKESAKQLTSHGLYLSLGKALFDERPSLNNLLKDINLDRLFLETDVEKKHIAEVYKKFSELTGVPLEKLCNIIFNNFTTIFH